MQITPIGPSVNQNQNPAFKAELNIKYAEDASIKLLDKTVERMKLFAKNNIGSDKDNIEITIHKTADRLYFGDVNKRNPTEKTTNFYAESVIEGKKRLRSIWFSTDSKNDQAEVTANKIYDYLEELYYDVIEGRYFIDYHKRKK